MYCQPTTFTGLQPYSLKPKPCTKCEAVIKRRERFKAKLKPFVEVYGREMMNAFYAYWSELNKSGTKMRWELEKIWQLNLRLSRWEKNQKFTTTPKQQAEFLNYYDAKFEKSLTDVDKMRYTQFLIKLGWIQRKTHEGSFAGWIKP